MSWGYFMTFKHIKFDNSPVMRSLERIAREKGLVKESLLEKIASRSAMVKKADLTPTTNLTENLIKLCSGLREEGFDKYANELESTFMMFKQAQTLYETSKETGEDLVDMAHPKGSHTLEGVSGDAVFETIIDQQLKDIKMVEKKPTGKLSNAKEIIDAVKYAFLKNSETESEKQSKLIDLEMHKNIDFDNLRKNIAFDELNGINYHLEQANFLIKKYESFLEMAPDLDRWGPKIKELITLAQDNKDINKVWNIRAILDYFSPDYPVAKINAPEGPQLKEVVNKAANFIRLYIRHAKGIASHVIKVYKGEDDLYVKKIEKNKQIAAPAPSAAPAQPPPVQPVMQDDIKKAHDALNDLRLKLTSSNLSKEAKQVGEKFILDTRNLFDGKPPEQLNKDIFNRVNSRINSAKTTWNL